MSTNVRLQEFYGNGPDIFIPVATDLFIPDTWTKTFARGIQALPSLAGKGVLEVGVGSGINLVGITMSPDRPEYFLGSDIDRDAVEASARLIREQRIPDVSVRQSDLLDGFEDSELSRVDHIIACIPQVLREGDLSEGEGYSHYYNPTGSEWDVHGLGLNARLLEGANDRAPRADITLNLSGRPGRRVLEDFFRAHGREPRVLHKAIVPQHIGTSLQSLAGLERGGAPDFEFFNGRCGTNPINARQAEEIRAAEEASGKTVSAVSHGIYVITAPGLR